MKFTGKNFQSWSDFEVEVNGLTVLTGPSDTGKSAIFRALHGIFYNELSDSYIRQGSEGMELTVEIDGHVIKATRALDESAKYEIDGKKFAKLGGRRPQELKDLAVNPITIGDTTLDPIFSEQSGAQFLIQGTSPAELNAILGGFASTEKLEYGKREANTRVSQKNSEAKTLAVEAFDASTRQAAFEQRVLLTTPLFHAVEVLSPLILSSEEQLGVIRVVIGYRDILIPLRATLKKLQIPDLDDVVRVAAQVQYLTIAHAAKERHCVLLSQVSAEPNTLWRKVKDIYYGVESASGLVKTREELKQLGQRLSSITEELTQAQVAEHTKQHEMCLTTCPECGAKF